MMEQFEEFLEKLKKTKNAEKFLKKTNLSQEEKQLIKTAEALLEAKPKALYRKTKKELWLKIQSNLPQKEVRVLSFRKRLAFALASLLILSSAVIGAAASTSTPETPLYALKEAYRKALVRIFRDSNVQRNILKKEVNEYENALLKKEVRKSQVRSKLKKTLEAKKRELLKLEKQNQNAVKNQELKKPAIKKNKDRSKSVMPPLKEPEKKMRETTIPPLENQTQEEINQRERDKEQNRRGR